MPLARGKTTARAQRPRANALVRAEVLSSRVRNAISRHLLKAQRGDADTREDARLGGALRALAPLAPSLYGSACDIIEQFAGVPERASLVKRAVRALGHAKDKRSSGLLRSLLERSDGESADLFSAACFSEDPSHLPHLSRLSRGKPSHVAFLAELCRVVRGASGARLSSLALMLKETYRIALCTEMLLPLLRRSSVPVHVAEGLGLLRGAERHLGRWLVLAEVAVRAGDKTPVAEAKERALGATAASRTGWLLVLWALLDGAIDVEGKLSSELVYRLSDRPSADRDLTFLFRLAGAKLPGAKELLEQTAGTAPFQSVAQVRAVRSLARDYERMELAEGLSQAAQGGPVAGLSAAALYDMGGPWQNVAVKHANALLETDDVANVAWAALVSGAERRKKAQGNEGPGAEVVKETLVRWIQCGALE